MSIEVIVTKVCGICKEDLAETCFRRYKNAKTGEYRRLKNCNACRQKNPKRLDLVVKKSSKGSISASSSESNNNNDR